MLYTGSCGCTFQVEIGYACCGSCQCMCDSYDAFDRIDSIYVEDLCDDHK